MCLVFSNMLYKIFKRNRINNNKKKVLKEPLIVGSNLSKTCNNKSTYYNIEVVV